MQKIFVLLRNNQQTGPYSLSELVQFELKPYDLIWIQGKSAGWYYPQEIKALHPYLSFIKKPSQPVQPFSLQKEKIVEPVAATNSFATMPTTVVKEEPTPFNFFETAKPSSNLSNETESLAAALSQNIAAPQNRNMKTIITPISQPKRKKQPVVSTTGIVIACVLVSVLGYFIAKPFMNGDDETTPEQTAPTPVQNEINATNASSTAVTQNNKFTSFKKQNQQQEVRVVRQITTIVQQPENESREVVADDIPVENNRTETAPMKNADKPAANDEKQNEPNATEAPAEKKKTLKDKIFDIFKKKTEDKEEDGERRSTHRETNLAQMVSIRFTIPTDWMLGIKGAKATLVNRSTETVAKAVVELLYYNDDNELLDKKIVSFGNVEGKDSKTISVPDHPTATRLEYNIISITGTGSPVAML